jgi:4-diphosphocytidyl-2-C-methyl-D-erythritol kinase
MHPEIGNAIDALEARGAHFALMSGSGSSVFGLFGSRAEAERVAVELTARLSWPCRAVRTLTEMPIPEVR